jgi:putative DNA primase/helicase
LDAYAREGRCIIPHIPDRENDDWNDELRERLRIRSSA